MCVHVSVCIYRPMHNILYVDFDFYAYFSVVRLCTIFIINKI